ncbi:MAG: hypothetical protein HDR94_07775 [Bacteroides sp.]|nr:hypothetical protein [Bacteroides sp.]
MQNRKYPYYIIPDIEALHNASGEERLHLVRKIAANVGDPVALRALVGIDPQEFLNFYPDMTAPELTTDETIDSFLDRFAPASMKTARTESDTEELIYAPAAPYDLSSLESLPELDSAPLLPSDPLLSGIPANPLPSSGTPANPHPSSGIPAASESSPQTPRPQHRAEGESPKSGENLKSEALKSSEEPSLSESLAKMMIKNGNYQKAIEIITEISLNNPKKSVYFADQIRFLKKLIKYTSVSD